MGNGPWSPVEQDLKAEDWQALKGWLTQGNALIVITTSSQSIPGPLRLDLFPSITSTPQEGAATFRLFEPTVDSEPNTTEAHDISNGALTVRADGPRCPLEPPGRRGQWADDQAAVMVRAPVGAGAVYLLLDDFAWTNAGFDHGDNAPVLSAVLGREVRGGVLGMDEYRHGHGRAESFLTYLARFPGSTAVLWIIILWSLLYLYGRNVRLQPAEAYQPIERRTAKEYIDAVAQLHERARAAPLVVEAVSRRWRHLSRGPAALPPSAEALLQRADDYVTKGARPPRPTAALDLVAELVRIRKEQYGSRTLS
jgi:hypothetical protein